MDKGVALLLITMLAVSSLILVESASAQSIPKPSVPEFTVNLVSHPYDVAGTTQIDPYTGKVYTYPGYVEENRSIEITIKNQPFTAYQMADGNWSRLYYNLRFKGHFSAEDWIYYPVSKDAGYSVNVNASLSEYTVISLDDGLYGNLMRAGSQIDFQVRALIGYDATRYGVSGNTGELILYGNYFTGESGDWSNTQTSNIPVFTPSSETSPITNSTSPASTTDKTTEPAVNDSSQILLLGIIIGAIVTIVFVSAGLLICLKRRRHQINPSSPVPGNN